MEQHFSQAEKLFSGAAVANLRMYPVDLIRLEGAAGSFACRGLIALHSSDF